MKKLLIVLAVIVSLSACGTKDDFDAAECYRDASKNMRELNALTSETSLNITMKVKDDSETNQGNIEFNSVIKADNLLNDDLTYQMSVKSINFDDTSEMKQWFLDGTVYTIEGNHRYAFSLDDEETAVNQDKVLQDFGFDDALKYKGKQVGDKKIISIELNAEKIEELLKKFDINLDDDAQKINFSDIELTINEAGYFENEKLKIKFEIEGVEFNADMNVNYRDFNNVTIDEFDPVSFNNIDAILEETQSISEALVKALDDIGYQNYGNGIFIKMVDDATTCTLDLGHNYLAIGEKLFDLNLNTYFDDETSCIYDFTNNLSEGECNSEALNRANDISQEAQIIMNLIEEHQ